MKGNFAETLSLAPSGASEIVDAPTYRTLLRSFFLAGWLSKKMRLASDTIQDFEFPRAMAPGCG
jgi:hypothetical protein